MKANTPLHREMKCTETQEMLPTPPACINAKPSLHILQTHSEHITVLLKSILDDFKKKGASRASSKMSIHSVATYYSRPISVSFNTPSGCEQNTFFISFKVLYYEQRIMGIENVSRLSQRLMTSITRKIQTVQHERPPNTIQINSIDARKLTIEPRTLTFL